MYIVDVKSAQESIDLANKLAKHLKAGMTILLEGDLGVGKTTFSKGIGQGLGVSRIIKSPTYTIIREYTDGRLPLYHMDLYRLEDSGIFELGLDDYFYGQGVSLVEWANLFMEDMPQDYLKISLKKGQGDTDRQIILQAQGGAYEKLIDEVKND